MGWESWPVIKDLKPPFSALKAEHLSSVTSPFLTYMLLVLTSVFTSYSSILLSYYLSSSNSLMLSYTDPATL